MNKFLSSLISPLVLYHPFETTKEFNCQENIAAAKADVVGQHFAKAGHVVGMHFCQKFTIYFHVKHDECQNFNAHV